MTQTIQPPNQTIQRLPLQPLVRDDHGTVRFRANAIVRTLLDEGGLDLNTLSLRCDHLSQEAWEQFFTLIGYSLSGFHELSRVSDETAQAASAEAKRLGLVAGGCRDDRCAIHSGVPREDV